MCVTVTWAQTDLSRVDQTRFVPPTTSLLPHDASFTQMESTLIALLASLKVTLPPNTKANATQLEQRLNKAMDGVQYISDITKNPTDQIGLSTLPVWEGPMLARALQRSTMKESLGFFDNGPDASTAPTGLDAFNELRWLVSMLGTFHTFGVSEVVVKNPEGTSLVSVTVSGTRQSRGGDS